MARYIDADKMMDGYCTTFPYNLEYCDEGDLIEWLNAQPTADVAPRAELDRVARELERVEALYFAKDTQLENAKAEVAREIFEEIEFDIHQLMFDREETRAIAIEGIIANLKKKYVGE